MTKVMVDSANGGRHEIDFDAVVNLMDDEVCESILTNEKFITGISNDPTSAQVFADWYATWHRLTFNETFVVD